MVTRLRIVGERKANLSGGTTSLMGILVSSVVRKAWQRSGAAQIALFACKSKKKHASARRVLQPQGTLARRTARQAAVHATRQVITCLTLNVQHAKTAPQTQRSRQSARRTRIPFVNALVDTWDPSVIRARSALASNMQMRKISPPARRAQTVRTATPLREQKEAETHSAQTPSVNFLALASGRTHSSMPRIVHSMANISPSAVYSAKRGIHNSLHLSI